MWGYLPGQPVTVESPAAGQPVLWPVPTGEPLLIQAVTFELVTAAAVANRIPFVAFVDPTGEIAACTAAPFTLAAAHTALYSFFVGGAQYGANNAEHIGGPLPALCVDDHMVLEVAVDAIAAADQIGNVRLYVQPYSDYSSNDYGD